MPNTVKIRYVGPQRDGLWIGSDVHGALDFPHGEFVDVPEDLARELLDQREPTGEPVKVPETEDAAEHYETPMAPVWELGGGEQVTAAKQDKADETKPRTRRGAGK